MPSKENEPATKGDLKELKTELNARMDHIHGELNARMDHIHGELNARMDHMHEDLVEKMRDMPTEVLRAFHTWARPAEIRMRKIDEIDQRMGWLEDRVSALERRDKPAV